MIRSSDLTGRFNTDHKDGLYAELDADGNIRVYGFYVRNDKGEPTRSSELRLSPGGPGTFEVRTFDRYSASDEDGDNDSFREWARRWIREIEREAQGIRSCSFCQKRQDEVRKLIAGPTQYICDECVVLCSEILSEP
ncbi:MAG: hypothetical protein JO219_01315 [Candidatus Eremiobacteraeota bacterium]|nr:hypothetical protein [Candidatus Eremiobacteraeota bacterium]